MHRDPPARPGGGAAREYRLPCGIHRAFTRADEAWRKELDDTTIASLVLGVMQEAPPAAVTKAARWLGEASIPNRREKKCALSH